MPTTATRTQNCRRTIAFQEFEPLSVIGEGHFGKVLLVRWNKSAEASAGGPSSSSSSLLRSRSSSSISITATGGGCSRHTRQSSSASVGVLGFPSTATIAEGYEEGSGKDSSSGNGISSSSDPATDGINAVTATATTTNRNNLTGRYGNRDRFLAVKEVALHKGTSLPGVLNERQILGVLREHPFVVTLRCAWRRGNFLYYGLDFLPGADLFELFRRNSIKMDLQAARVYGGQIALALEHLHEHGICYRDLKVRSCARTCGLCACVCLVVLFVAFALAGACCILPLKSIHQVFMLCTCVDICREGGMFSAPSRRYVHHFHLKVLFVCLMLCLPFRYYFCIAAPNVPELSLHFFTCFPSQLH